MSETAKEKGRSTSVWFNESDRKRLEDKSASIGLSLSAFLKMSALQKDISNVKISHIEEADPKLISELNRIGNNINQIASASHRGIIPNDEILENILAELEALKDDK